MILSSVDPGLVLNIAYSRLLPVQGCLISKYIRQGHLDAQVLYLAAFLPILESLLQELKLKS